MANVNRRKFVMGAGVAAAAAAPLEAASETAGKKVVWANGKKPEGQQMFSPVTTFGDLVFLSGIGAHTPGDIKAPRRNTGTSMASVCRQTQQPTRTRRGTGRVAPSV